MKKLLTPLLLFAALGLITSVAGRCLLSASATSHQEALVENLLSFVNFRDLTHQRLLVPCFMYNCRHNKLVHFCPFDGW